MTFRRRSTRGAAVAVAVAVLATATSTARPAAAAGTTGYEVYDGTPGGSRLVSSLVDVDRDGNLDIVSGRYGLSQESGFQIELGNGDGTFAAPLVRTLANTGFSAAVGHVDAGGVVDVVVVTNDGVVHAYLNVPGGLFDEAPVTVASTGLSGLDAVALEDLDADGDDDLVVAAGATVQVLRNDGAGAFEPGATASITSHGGSQPLTITTGDVNGDGATDIVVPTDTTTEVLLGGAGGTYALTSVATSPYPGVALVDLEGDGSSEVLLPRGSDLAVLRWVGGIPQVDSVWSDATGDDGLLDVSAAAAGDLDGDGDLDLTVAGGAEVVRLLQGAAGTFLAADPTPATAGFPTHQLLADVDGLGGLDIVTTMHEPTDLSASRLLLAHAAPSVITAPADTTVSAGGVLTLTAAGSGRPRPAVHWEASTDGGVTWGEVVGQTSTTLTLSDVPYLADGFRYRAVFSNSLGTATSSAALLTVAPTSPVVTRHPVDQATVAGGSASFSSTASGDPAPTVQWQTDPDGDGPGGYADVPGAVGATLSLSGLTTSQSGTRVRAVWQNAGGTVHSDPAALVVNSAVSAPPPAPVQPEPAPSAPQPSTSPSASPPVIVPTPEVPPTSAPLPSVPPTPASSSAPRLSVVRQVVAAGNASLVRGTAAPGATVRLYGYVRPSTSYRLLRTGRAAADGSYAFDLRPTGNMRAYVQVNGVKSDTVVQTVRSTVTLVATGTGRAKTFSGRVLPARAGRVVTISVEVAGRAVRVATARTSATGAFRASHRFAHAGRRYVATAATGTDLVTLGGRSSGSSLSTR